MKMSFVDGTTINVSVFTENYHPSKDRFNVEGVFYDGELSVDNPKYTMEELRNIFRDDNITSMTITVSNDETITLENGHVFEILFVHTDVSIRKTFVVFIPDDPLAEIGVE